MIMGVRLAGGCTRGHLMSGMGLLYLSAFEGMFENVAAKGHGSILCIFFKE